LWTAFDQYGVDYYVTTALPESRGCYPTEEPPNAALAGRRSRTDERGILILTARIHQIILARSEFFLSPAPPAWPRPCSIDS